MRTITVKDALKEAIIEELDNDTNYFRDDGFGVRLQCDDIFAPENRGMIKNFFKEWLNTFVNVVRPRLKGQ